MFSGDVLICPQNFMQIEYWAALSIHLIFFICIMQHEKMTLFH